MEHITKKNIEICMKEHKKKVYFYTLITIFLIVILLFLNYVLLLKGSFVFIFPLFFLFFSGILYQIYYYIRIIKIKKYMNKNNISIEDEKILFWNKSDFLLTEGYVFIIKNRRINCFKYEDIVKIQKYECYKTGSAVGGSFGTSLDVKLYKYLYISFDDCTTYKILIYQENFFEEEDIDVASILLEKNPQIQKEDDIADPWYYAYKRR